MEVPSRDQFDDLENKVARLEEQLNALMHFCNVPKKYKIDYQTFDTLEEAKEYYNNALKRWHRLHPKPTKYQQFYLPIYISYDLPEVKNEV